MNIGEKIKELMHGKYTQNKIVEEFKKRGYELSQPNLSKKLMGKVDISIEELIIFANILCKDIFEFFD